MNNARVVVDGVSMFIKRTGRGVPVVCLPAIGHDAEDFLALAQRVGHRCELICIEWPGHGDSGPDHVAASAARYAELVEGALKNLALESPILLGNSIGGAAAILYAARCPLQALVLCDSGGLVEVSNSVRRFCRWFEALFAAGERGAWWYPALFALYYRLVLTEPAAAKQRRRIVAHARKRAPAMREAWASFVRPEADIRAVAAELDIPIWVAWAKKDRVIPLGICMPALRRLKHYTLDVFNAGHCAFLEQPDAFSEAFMRFLDTLSSRASSADAVQVAESEENFANAPN